MALDSLQTFSNRTGGATLFKALGHPLAVAPLRALVRSLSTADPVSIYDPHGYLPTLAALYDLSAVQVEGVYVHDVEAVGKAVLGHPARALTDLAARPARRMLALTFDPAPMLPRLWHLLAPGAEVLSLAAARLPEDMLSNASHYLDRLNFATNLALFRDGDGLHTRLVTANYWRRYGAHDVVLWLCLFDADGRELARWQQVLPDAPCSVVIDSGEVRRRFGLGPFAGSLYLHAQRIAGHDVIKYALDTCGDDPRLLSCTHDANAWPAQWYAGLPAPAEGERVRLWVQNSHPCPIPSGAVAVRRMGTQELVRWRRPVPGYGTAVLDVEELLGPVRWPAQIEVLAGKHFVRPRYEVLATAGRRRIAHMNVQRTDLDPDPNMPSLGQWFGKGFLVAAPVLPPARWRSIALPTPMATSQLRLPVQLVVYDADGSERARHRFGCLRRQDSIAVDAGELLGAAGAELESGYGHMELSYDFEAGEDADGWLHGLFRYLDIGSGHQAETSFGAHLFNSVMVYRGEPQSYSGRPPGLTTRLFLRLGSPPLDTICHLIYPASTPWRPYSDTRLRLYDGSGQRIAERTVRIPCGGSRLLRCAELFDAADWQRAAGTGYVIVRDRSCRLFGYHGLDARGQGFALDHMFGF